VKRWQRGVMSATGIDSAEEYMQAEPKIFSLRMCLAAAFSLRMHKSNDPGRMPHGMFLVVYSA